MYNKKSKASAILVIITALLFIGFMILLPFLKYQQGEDENALAGLFITFFSIFGYPVIYVSSIPYALVALIFGFKMLKQQSRNKLISYNSRMLITSCVLLPFLALGFMVGNGLIFHSTLGLLPVVYVIVIAFAYVAALIAQIAAIVKLKKMPEENNSDNERYYEEERVRDDEK